jgi:hypothetical protein
MDTVIQLRRADAEPAPIPYLPALAATFSTAEPECVTILPTYRCNAACRECCFESDPTIKHRMSKDDLLTLIRRIRTELPRVRYVVLSGGEVTLLRDDLIEAIALLTELGLGSRIVTNGHWGRTDDSARQWVRKFVEAGLCELNLSTGDEHLEWVPLQSVARAALAATRARILTLIVVEGSNNAQFRIEQLRAEPMIAEILASDEARRLFILMTNVWMPFHEGTGITNSSPATHEGCDNIFENYVINPYGHLMSCCGLTMEYIPELKIGTVSGDRLHPVYTAQFGDLIKLWIWLDGTQALFDLAVKRSGRTFSSTSPHPCAVCAQIYRTPELRETVIAMAQERAEEIVFRAAIKARMSGRIDT